MVYNINNLREAVETAKCMLTKEQIDGHKSGQAASSPFMKVNQQNFKKKGVTFNAMETIQKQGDSIDKLTSLMNELNSKLDRKDNSSQYKPRIHAGRNRVCRQRQNRYSSRERSYSRDRGPYNDTVETEGIIKTKTIMVLEALEIGIEITRKIDQITEGKILTKVMAKDFDTEA